jgi:hypothetical protein
VFTEAALHLCGGHEVTRHIEHVVYTACHPQVTVLVSPGSCNIELLLLLLLLLFGGDLEAGILSQPTRKFPLGVRQPRLIVLATGRKQSTPIIHMHQCAYDNGSEKGREGWVRWMKMGSVS